MKYPPALVAAVIAAVVLLLLESGGSPCRSSSALRLDGACGAAAFYMSSR